jgi:hypothetical protein
MRHLLLACLLLLGGLALPTTSHAAECTEITSPYTQIAASGHYCLGNNLVVSTNSQAVISIAADDVDLDCRGYSIINQVEDGNGNGYGIHLQGRHNVHVSNCRIHGGFAAGIYAYQDNSWDNYNTNLSFTGNFISNTEWFGILAYGTDIEISGNRIYNIGGRNSFAMGIRVGGSVIPGVPRSFVVRDNVIRGVHSPVNNGYGIYANNANDSTFADNVITRTSAGASYTDLGIKIQSGGNNKITGNQLHGSGGGNSIGIVGAASDACFDNFIRAHNLATSSCDNSLGNH